MKARLSQDGTKLVTSYELSPIDFDRTGVLKLWTLSQLISYSGPEESPVFYIPGHLKTVASFVRYQEFYLHPEFYTKVKFNSTVEVVSGVGFVGKTSWICKGDVRLAKSQDIICHFNLQLVNVDMSTRQPTALPQNLRLKGKGPRPTFDLPMASSSQLMYSDKFRVEESDVDANDHAKQSAFIRFCSDAAVFGTKAGCFPSLREDLLKFHVKKIAMLFQKEALLGDMLGVESWEIPSKPSNSTARKKGVDNISPGEMASVNSVSDGKSYAASEVLLAAAQTGSIQGVKAALKDGFLTTWTLSKLIMYSRPEQSAVFYMPGFLETVASFLRYQEIHLHPEFYTKVKFNSTVEVVAGVGYVGKTSWICQGHVRLATSQDILCHYNCQLVYVDISTRQPIVLPQHLRLKGKGLRPTFDLSPVSPNTPMYSHKFSIVESDIDGNGHTNQSVFIRLCSDTAVLGTKAGCYPSLSGDVLKYRVKKIAMLFQEESLVGDMLEVQSWEISSKPVSLEFLVKRGQDCIVRCSFEFFAGERAKL
uniref:Uncharacterized protein n=1 Tax=Branchiostoma floridae TaxID=7739 RepID=C3YSD3_BRAFL|eukprot:XP_002601026.1 hypothetical protein BRAFLDRAFT_96938 [Branchiostoma floridae]